MSRTIPDYTNYKIDLDGTVISYKNNKPYILKQSTINGYKSVTLYSDNNKKKQIHVHRLLLLTYIGLPPDDDIRYCADHIDRDRGNNSLDNLRWVTYSENLKNSSRFDS